MELFYFLGVVAAWFVLMKWVLPKFGVNTCLSNRCPGERHPASEPGPPHDHQGPGCGCGR